MKSETRMEGELVSFTTVDGVELEGMLCKATRSKTCLVHVHGMTDSFYGLRVVDHLMHAAYRNEINFFAFNNRGQGTITTFSSLKEHHTYRRIGTSFENFKDCLRDIDSALKALRKRGYDTFILSGHSTGCQKITYYQFRRNKKSIKGIILLAPADDYNFQIKLLGKKKHKETIQIARKLVRAGKGRELMPYEAEPSYFSAKRYYELYSGAGVEAGLFDYEGKLRAVSEIKVPFLTFFGSKEEYAAMPPRKMLKILSRKYQNEYSKSVLIRDADHCFCGHEEEVEMAVSNWLKNLIW